MNAKQMLLDKVCRQERAILRLTRKLGRSNWRLKQAKKGCPEHTSAEAVAPTGGTPAEEARLRGLVANLRDDDARKVRRIKELEERVRELVAQPKASDQVVSLAAYQHLQGQEQRLREKHATLDKHYARVVDEREDALEREKRANDRAQALLVVMDQAVHALGKVHYERTYQENCVWIDQAVHILTSEDNVVVKDEARSLLDQIRMKVGGAAWGNIIPAIEKLQANAASREAEGLERTRSLTDLENRIERAAKALHKVDVEDVNGCGRAISRALSWLASDRAGGEA